MFRQRFANPAIFSLVGSDNYNQVVSSRIVRVQEISDKAQKTKASGQ